MSKQKCKHAKVVPYAYTKIETFLDNQLEKENGDHEGFFYITIPGFITKERVRFLVHGFPNPDYSVTLWKSSEIILFYLGNKDECLTETQTILSTLFTMTFFMYHEVPLPSETITHSPYTAVMRPLSMEDLKKLADVCSSRKSFY